MEQQNVNMINVYEDEDEIDLKALIIAVLRKWRILIVTAILFAVLFGGYKGLTGFLKLQDPEYVQEQTDAVNEAQEQYETQKEMYEAQLKNLESEVRTLNDYREKSLYMNIDPYNEYRETVTYYVNTDYQIMPGMDYQNINQATSILNAYVRQVQDFNVFGQVVNLIGKDMNISDIRELVQVQQDNANFMFTVTIVGENEEIPSVLMDVVRETVEKSKKEIENTIGAHTIEEVTFTSGYTVDTALSDIKIRFEDNVTKLHDAMAKKQKALDELKTPSGEEPSQNVVLKQSIKFAVIGGFCGGILAALWACMIFFLGDQMPDETVLKDKYGIRILGSCRGKMKQKAFSFVDGWIDRIEGIDKAEYDEEKAFRFVAANLDSCVKCGKTILLVGTVSEERFHRAYCTISKFLEKNNFCLCEGGNLVEDPNVVRKLAKADAVIFVESRNETKKTQFLKAFDMVNNQNKDIVGLVLC